MLNKNLRLTVTIESVDFQMNGVAHADGCVIFVPGALDGETVDILIIKAAKNYAIGKIDKIISASPDRRESPCPYYKQCGGCSALHMTYEKTLSVKRSTVQQTLSHVGGIDVPVLPVIGMDEPFRYRNKTAMPVGIFGENIVSGYYSPRSHRLVPIGDCLIAQEESTAIGQIVLDWMREFHIKPFDENSKTGLVRHILTRISRKGESMLCLCVSDGKIPHVRELTDRLTSAIHGLVSICATVNVSGDNVILGDSYRVLWGTERLNDTLCGLNFDLSPLSFFQINPIQTEKLYQTALSLADPKDHELVIDLYCGAGTISLLLASRARKVIGIEIVPQAIEDANKNAVNNYIENAEFYAAAAETLLPKLVKDGLAPDVVVLDPPRKGAEPEVLRAIAQAAPSRIVYVSCSQATLARDLKLLNELGYSPRTVQPVDMFCWTEHVENAVLLTRNNA